MIRSTGKVAARLSSAWWGRWLWNLGPLVALVVVYGLFAALDHRMLSAAAISGVVQQTVIVGVAAIGMTLVILAAGIDLSVGSIIALASVMAALALAEWGLPLWAAVAVAVGSGAACGALNGVLITSLRVVPFIVTLGTLLIYRGIAKGLAGSMPINVRIEGTWIGGLVEALRPEYRWMIFPDGGWLMMALAALTAAMVVYTRLGRHVVAVGSNEATARLCGIAVERVKIFVYAMAGAFAGLSGLMLVSYQRQGDPTGAEGYELDVIAAVVIGGGSLAGGQGSVFGSLLGAMLMTVIRTGCQLNGWPPWVTQVVTGAVIVAAVAADRWRHGRRT
jgi:ribose transport system permease protein